MIPTLPFGRTGHASTRIIFGAAALHSVTQEAADAVLEVLLRNGINHIDCAASYGDAELRLAPWMARRRDDFFLATKTGDRDYEGARASIERSLQRMGVERIDLIQLHNLVDEAQHAQALGPDGALRACVEARDAGKVRFIGVTGHGTRVARMHLRSLEAFDFDSVLLPYSFPMMAQPEYAAEFERLADVCAERNVAIQTIKAIARRRWAEGATPTRTTWYEPLEEQRHIDAAIHWALARPGIFVNTASDPVLLERTLDAAQRFEHAPSDAHMREDTEQAGVQALFIRGYAEGVGRA